MRIKFEAKAFDESQFMEVSGSTFAADRQLEFIKVGAFVFGFCHLIKPASRTNIVILIAASVIQIDQTALLMKQALFVSKSVNVKIRNDRNFHNETLCLIFVKPALMERPKLFDSNCLGSFYSKSVTSGTLSRE